MEEVNGSPSVHRILEDLGVIDTEECAAPQFITANSTQSTLASEKVKSKTLSRPPKVQKQQRPELRKDIRTQGVGHQKYSPTPSSSCTLVSKASQLSTGEEQPCSPIQVLYVSPPPVSRVSSQRSSDYGSTPSPWDSPEFAEDLFTTPGASSLNGPLMAPQDYQSSPGIHDRYFEAPSKELNQGLQQTGPFRGDAYTTDSTLNTIGDCRFQTETEPCNAGYFYDATWCEIGTGVGIGSSMYEWAGPFDNMVGNQGFVQDHNAWNSGVLV